MIEGNKMVDCIDFFLKRKRKSKPWHASKKLITRENEKCEMSGYGVHYSFGKHGIHIRFRCCSTR